MASIAKAGAVGAGLMGQGIARMADTAGSVRSGVAVPNAGPAR